MEEPEDGVLYYEMLSLDKTEIAHRNLLQLRLPAQEQATQISQHSSMKCQLDLVVLLLFFFFFFF